MQHNDLDGQCYSHSSLDSVPAMRCGGRKVTWERHSFMTIISPPHSASLIWLFIMISVQNIINLMVVHIHKPGEPNAISKHVSF